MFSIPFSIFSSSEMPIQVNKIKEVLQKKGITQTSLAERLSKSYNMVNAYVQNRRQPSLEDLYRIAEILDVEISDLLVKRKRA